MVTSPSVRSPWKYRNTGHDWGLSCNVLAAGCRTIPVSVPAHGVVCLSRRDPPEGLLTNPSNPCNQPVARGRRTSTCRSSRPRRSRCGSHPIPSSRSGSRLNPAGRPAVDKTRVRVPPVTPRRFLRPERQRQDRRARTTVHPGRHRMTPAVRRTRLGATLPRRVGRLPPPARRRPRPGLLRCSPGHCSRLPPCCHWPTPPGRSPLDVASSRTSPTAAR